MFTRGSYCSFAGGLVPTFDNSVPPWHKTFKHAGTSVVAKAQAQKFNVVGDYGDAYAGDKSWAVTIPFEFAGHNR